MEFKINLPAIKVYSSDNYSLIILDSAGITHYWNDDGSYDGFSSDPHVDYGSGSCLN